MRLSDMNNLQKFYAADLRDRIFQATYKDEYQKDFREDDYSEESENDQAHDIFQAWGVDTSKVPKDMRAGEFAISLVPAAREILRSQVDPKTVVDLVTDNPSEYEVICQMIDGYLPMDLNQLMPDAKAHAESFIGRISDAYQLNEEFAYPVWGTVHGQIVEIINQMPSVNEQEKKGINKALLIGGAAALALLLS